MNLIVTSRISITEKDFLMVLIYIERIRMFRRTEVKCNGNNNPVGDDDSNSCDGNGSLGEVNFAAVLLFEQRFQCK